METLWDSLVVRIEDLCDCASSPDGSPPRPRTRTYTIASVLQALLGRAVACRLGLSSSHHFISPPTTSWNCISYLGDGQSLAAAAPRETAAVANAQPAPAAL